MKQNPIKTDNQFHSDESGDARIVKTHSIMDDCGTGGVWGTWMTPAEEAAYNDGMAKLAAMD